MFHRSPDGDRQSRRVDRTEVGHEVVPSVYGTSVKKRVSLEGAADTDKLPTIEYAVAEVVVHGIFEFFKSLPLALKVQLGHPKRGQQELKTRGGSRTSSPAG